MLTTLLNKYINIYYTHLQTIVQKIKDAIVILKGAKATFTFETSKILLPWNRKSFKNLRIKFTKKVVIPRL